jgi:hypothetical protein
MFRRSYPIEDFNSISNTISIDYLTFCKTLLKETAFFPKKNHINYIGEYSNSNYSDVSDWETVVKWHYYDEGKVLSVSRLATNCLDSIVQLCESKGVKLILANSPVHEHYLNKIPKSISEEYNILKKTYGKKHMIFDRSKDQYPDSLYLNSDHLNAKGAKRYTNELIKYLADKTDIHNVVLKK